MTSILDRHWERFRAAPGDARAFEALEEHLFLAGNWDEVLALYEHRLNAPAIQADAHEQAQLLYRMAQLAQERLNDSERAVAWLRGAITADPTNRPALSQLRGIHAEREQWDVALQIAEVEAGLPMRAEERAGLFADIGSIWLDRLEDPELALTYFERALEASPERKEALDGAARASERMNDPRRAADAWERLAAQLRGPECAAALVSLARLAEVPPGPAEGPPGLADGPPEQGDRAGELYRRALAEDPQNPVALEAVSALAAEREQWPLFADLQERRLELPGNPERRAEIALEAARVEREHIGNPKAARAWLMRAVENAPDDARVPEALAELAREQGDDAALADSLRRLAELRRDETPVELLLEIASLCRENGDNEQALVYLQRAHERAPDDPTVAEALCDALGRGGREEDLVEVLERRAAVTSDSPARAAVLTELAVLQEERLEDLEGALRSWERAYSAEPSTEGVAIALDRLYRKNEDWNSLRALLEDASRRGPQEHRGRFLASLGHLLIDRLDEPVSATEALEAALEVDPELPDAHRALQKLAVDAGDESAVLTAYEREAATSSDRARLAFLVGEIARRREARGEPDVALGWAQRWVEASPEDTAALSLCAHLQEALGQIDGLVETLERLDGLLGSSERAANRRRIGDRYAANGRVEEAIDAYERALDAEPGDLAALGSLCEQLGRAGRLKDLASAKRRLADHLTGQQRWTCLDELATLFAERLGDLSGAIDALQLLAEERGTANEFAERLESLLERAGRHEELANQLRERARLQRSENPEAAAAADLRRASLLLDHLEDIDGATGAFRSVLEHDPECEEARGGLERALRASGDVTSLVYLLEEKAASASDPVTRARSAFERAVLLEEELSDAATAREIYETLSADAAEPGIRAHANERLIGLLERSGAWSALREHLEGALDAAANPAEVHERLARLNRDRFSDRPRAITHLEAVVRVERDRADLWRSLAQLYHEEGRNEEVVAAMEAEIATGPEPGRELTLQSRSAELCAGPLCDMDRAVAHYERVLALDPTHAGAAEFLIEHWERTGRLGDVVQLLETRLAALDAEPRDGSSWAARRTSLRLRIAGLRAGPLDDLDGAIGALEPAIGEIGPRGVAAEPLADLYQRAGYTEDLCELCRAAAAASTESAERARWYVRLGEALRGASREREAVAAYRHALGERPDDRETQTALRALYRRLGDHGPLARLLEAELAKLAGEDEIPARMELASLYAEPLEKPGDALVQLRRVLQIEPAHREAFDRALHIATSLEDTDSLLELLDTALESPLPRGERAALLSRRGALLTLAPGRLPEAIAAYREALTLAPSRSEDLTAMREALEREGDFAGVLDCLYQQAAAAEGEARVRVLEQAARIAEEHLSPDAALPWLSRLMRERPEDPAIAASISDVHRRCARPEALLRSLDRELDLARGDPRRSMVLHVERARILETDLSSPARAAAAYEVARELMPGNAEVLAELDRLYRMLQRPRQRVRILESLLADGDPMERVAILCEAASIYAGPLGEPHRAAAHLRAALASAPRAGAMRAELLRSLGESIRACGEVEAWATCAEEELRALDPEAPVFQERRRELRRSLARTYADELGRPGDTLRHLRALADTEAGDGADAMLDAVEPALLDLLRAEANPIELAERLARHLERRPENPEGWLELARLRDEKLRAPEAASEAYRRVLELSAGNLHALRGLRGAAERLGNWQELARTLETELEIVGDERRAGILHRLGDVCWERLQSTTRASRYYAAAVEADPEDFAALRSLQRLLEAMEDWRGALDLYESEIDGLGERNLSRRVEAAIRAGQIARDRTQEPERALRSYAYAAALSTLPSERLAELASLYEACGDHVNFVDTFGRWCDDPESNASCDDFTRLAEALEELGRPDEALARIEGALEIDPGSSAAWDVAARLRDSRGDAASAASALERAAKLVPDEPAAAERLLRAAELVEGDDLDRADALLREAARRDPAAHAVQAALARVSEELCDYVEGVLAAGRALDLGAEGTSRLEAALCGARCARQRGDYEAAARLGAEALEVDPAHPEALARHGETLAGLGDLPGAREVLEKRLALDAEHPRDDTERGLHLAILGTSCEEAEQKEEAREFFEQALDADPRLDRAHESLVRLHEAADRVDEGVAALERWADVASEANDRAARLLRAARWEIQEGDRDDRAEQHLRGALDADPTCAEAWRALAELLYRAKRSPEALEVARLALGSVSDGAGEHLGPLALLAARSLEGRGDREEAAAAYGAAATADRRCTEAALSQARLLRGIGEWRAAADALESFAAAHPGDDPTGLADVLQQCARLLAGPLEDGEGAIEAYRRAIGCDPTRTEARAALAEFLSHRPSDWDEALSHQKVLIEADPTDTAPLRGALRIARARGNEIASARGFEILCALGCASPHEREEAPPPPNLPFAGGGRLSEPLWEKLREAVQVAASEIAEAMGTSQPSDAIGSGDASGAFRAATLAAHGRLAAPALQPLAPDELGEVVTVLATLTLAPEEVHGEGRLVNGLTASLKRRTRKRLRRLLEGESAATIARVDWAAWRSEVRGLAAAVALDEGEFTLREALVALACPNDERPPGDEADLTALVEASPAARALLCQVEKTWLAVI